MRLKISARKSDLARLQAYMVGEALQKTNAQIEIEYRFKESLGDINLTDPLWKIPEKGVFTEDFYGELIHGDTDMVVHSWKDLPTELKSDTMIAATLPRADQRDLLLIKKNNFEKIRMAKTLRIFSSSPRREYNLTEFFKTHLPFGLQTVKFENVRGNIPTRIRKLLESTEVDGLIVAKAALDRLLSTSQPEFAETQKLLRDYLRNLEWSVLPLSVNPNAAAQGALAIEIAAHRTDLKDLLAQINDIATFQCAQKEREILASFGGGCHQKIGVAVLARPYGELTLLKGLTDSGVVLDKRHLATQGSAEKFAAQQMWAAEFQISRKELPMDSNTLPPKTNALFVSRSEAWPSNFVFPYYIWTAGLKTWRNLAQKGLWVHGCSEGLGEQEEAHLDILAQNRDNRALQWAKLSHAAGYVDANSAMTLVPTYALEISGPSSQDFERLLKESPPKCFFWNSGSQFLAAAQLAPKILDKTHCCGPGNTYKVIRKFLEEKNLFDPQKLRIFLDQDDWRHQCTK